MKLDVPLTLDTPQYVPVAEKRGHVLTATKTNNRVLKRVFSATEDTYLDDPDAYLNRLTTTVRWSLLELSRHACSAASGLEIQTLINIEEPTASSRRQRDVMSRLLTFWRSKNVPELVQEQLLSAIERRIGGMGGFYAKLGYDMGFDALKEASKLSERTLWSRITEQYVPDALEVFTVISTLYQGRGKVETVKNVRFEEGKEAWRQAKQAELVDERGLESELAEFLLGLEIYVAQTYNLPLRSDVLRLNTHQDLAMNQETILKILNGQLVPWKFVQNAAQRVCTPEVYDRLASSWDSLVAYDAERPSFAKQFYACCKRHGVSMSDLHYTQQITTVAERAGKSDQGKSYRADTVRTIIDGGGISAQTCARAMVAQVAEDTKEANELKQSYTDERRRFHTRAGSRAVHHHLDMVIAREWNGVRLIDLAAYLLRDENPTPSAIDTLARRISAIEYGGIRDNSIDKSELRTIDLAVEAIGKQKVSAVLKRLRLEGQLPEHCTQFETVREAAALLIEGVGSASLLSDRIGREASSIHFHINERRLRLMARGEDCPPLPLVTHMLECCNLTLDEKVKRDWYEQFPEYLRTRCRGGTARPLPRMLLTLVHAEQPTAKSFAQEHLPVYADSCVSNAISLLKAGKWPGWDAVERILSAAGIGCREYLWRFAEHLYWHDNNLQSGLALVVPSATQNKKTLHPIDFPGLTMQEMRDHVPRELLR